MINDREDLRRLIARADAQNRAEGTPTYADRVEVGYQAYEIGLWELRRDNHAGAGYWLRIAVDFGVDDARPLLAICLGEFTSSPTPAGTAPPPALARTALGAFTLDFVTGPVHLRDAARTWFPRRDLINFRSVARLAARARNLDRVLDRARSLNRDRLRAGGTDRAQVLTRDLAAALRDAHARAVRLKGAVGRDRFEPSRRAGFLANARDRADNLVRALGQVCTLVPPVNRELDQAIDYALHPVRYSAFYTALTRIRDHDLERAYERALDHAVNPARVRELAVELVPAGAGDRGADLDRAIVGEVDRADVLKLARAIAEDRALDPVRCDRYLIAAVTTLEKLVPPV